MAAPEEKAELGEKAAENSTYEEEATGAASEDAAGAGVMGPPAARGSRGRGHGGRGRGRGRGGLLAPAWGGTPPPATQDRELLGLRPRALGAPVAAVRGRRMRMTLGTAVAAAPGSLEPTHSSGVADQKTEAPFEGMEKEI